MPASIPSINLIGEQDLGHTPWGRLLTWATTYGRYIMISTEIVVLLAFISRFSLDRKLTDLNEEISQKQEIITANLAFENEIRSIQNRIDSITSLIAVQKEPVGILSDLQRSLPPDVYFETLDLNDGKLTVKTFAGTTDGFAQFLANISANTKFSGIEVGEIKKNPITGIQFQWTTAIKPVKTAAR